MCLFLVLFCNILCFSSFAPILIGNECFTLIAFLISCDCYCSVALPHGGVTQSAVCDCGLTYFCFISFKIRDSVNLGK